MFVARAASLGQPVADGAGVGPRDRPIPAGKVPYGSISGGLLMRRLIRDFVDRRRSKAETRRRSELRRAARQMQHRDANEDSIWRSGKGGGHHDRI